MLGRLSSVLLTTALLTGSAVVASPAEADAGYRWRFDVRPEGLPSAAEPAQTLVSAGALVWDGTGTSFDATVRLGGVPSAATDAVLRVALGTVVDGTCDERWSTEVHTFEPAGIASRTDDTLTFRAGLGRSTDYGVRCGSVTVLSSSGSVLDRLEETGDDEVIHSEPGGDILVREVQGLRVRSGEWTRLWIRLDYSGAPATGIYVDARKTDRVRVRSTEMDAQLSDGDSAWVPLRVKLRGDRPAELTIRIVAPTSGFGAGASTTVTLRPRR